MLFSKLKWQAKFLTRFVSKNMASKRKHHEDNKFDTFRKICDEIAGESSYLKKAEILQRFFEKGTSGKGFEGDTLLWVQFLIPAANQRVYNLQNKALIKLFSRVFNASQQQMHLDLEQDGDVSETLRKHFAASKKLKPQAQSKLYLQEVEQLLVKLVERTKEDEQTELLKELCSKATDLDLRTFIRLVKHDLRINARASHILDAFGPEAYPAYQSSRDLVAIVAQFAGKGNKKAALSPVKKAKQANTSGIQVMTPISPMLASPCKSVDEAFKKSPAGLYSEIKYDGERVQIHKQGNDFKFFSRNLKPVVEHKIKALKEHIPRAFPGAGEMILDSEIILVDTDTGALLPFGSLGAHKKQTFANAAVCLFVFDCILYDGEDLTQLPFRKRREILEQNIQPIKSHVQLSESEFLKTKRELAMMTAKVLHANLEGVVLKSPTSTYQPGKRNWLKVKKDYLFDGKMADTADLVVLGAWYGSGKKGGVLSIFLMGCYDAMGRLWKTVTKVHSGLDDATNAEVHDSLIKLTERADANATPEWLLCSKSLVPDVLAKDPLKMPVWEITGAEFTKSEAHTASGISIRFPRITRRRSDKSAKEANDLSHLEDLFDASKKNVNVDLLLANCGKLDKDLNIEKTPTKVLKPSSSQASNSKKLKRSKTGSDDEDPAPPVSKRKEAKAEKRIPPSQKGIRDFLKPSKEIQTVVKKEPKEERKTPDPISSKSKLFDGLIAHFAMGKDPTNLKEQFSQQGGLCTTDTRQANLVFYNMDETLDLKKLRSLYPRNCRHLNVSWLQTSLETQSRQPFPLYAVMLKS
ncbi:LOW QUALITY PROTEIN: DNA ligase 3 [Drosophila eugracilis]|uniref:LOW QUALITY PROTEIN: DNA ligase 3 n=1 Tax=Drosophila eugracilis TaxID=29029 RepID=UPI001BD93973|nr:LOW QUALITY PROTEIN: DNA ligase 3 [Drosophila eugracilis]